jgi:hypothetical protein
MMANAQLGAGHITRTASAFAIMPLQKNTKVIKLLNFAHLMNL